MLLPFELVQMIYLLSDIETKLSFHKAFGSYFFYVSKLSLPYCLNLNLNNLCYYKFLRFQLHKSLLSH